MEPIDERIINVVTGIWMICCGISLLMFGIMLGPYLGALPIITRCMVAIPTAVILGFGISFLVIHGAALACGRITIGIEPCGGK